MDAKKALGRSHQKQKVRRGEKKAKKEKRKKKSPYREPENDTKSISSKSSNIFFLSRRFFLASSFPFLKFWSFSPAWRDSRGMGFVQIVASSYSVRRFSTRCCCCCCCYCCCCCCCSPLTCNEWEEEEEKGGGGKTSCLPLSLSHTSPHSSIFMGCVFFALLSPSVFEPLPPSLLPRQPRHWLSFFPSFIVASCLCTSVRLLLYSLLLLLTSAFPPPLPSSSVSPLPKFLILPSFSSSSSSFFSRHHTPGARAFAFSNQDKKNTEINGKSTITPLPHHTHTHTRFFACSDPPSLSSL